MSYYIKCMDTIEAMEYLSPEQEQEAKYFYNMGLRYAKNNDFSAAAENYKKAVALGHPDSQNNLGILYKQGKGVEQDLERAFALHLDAAVHGNVYAMKNVAICYYKGEGISQDFELALSWMRTATLRFDARAMLLLGVFYENPEYGDWNKARYWYEQALHSDNEYAQNEAKKALSTKFRFGSARSAEELWEKTECNRLSDIPNKHFHGKEFYHKDVNFTKFVYEDKIYYKTNTHICCSNLDATDVCQLVEEKSHNPYIVVNETGLYIYAIEELYFEIKRFDFYGNLLQTYRENKYVKNLYVYNDYVYFVQEHARGDVIKRLDMSIGACRTIYQHTQAIDKLYATASTLIFCTHSQWYFYDIIMDAIEDLGEGSRNIEFWDLNRNIYWERVQDYEAEYFLVPRPIFGKEDEVVEEAPVWKIPSGIDCAQRRYFDGIRHYYSVHYSCLASSNQYGHVCDWKERGHGSCNEFEVMGGYLFVDISADGEEQYFAKYVKGEMLRKSWFK